MLPVVIHVAVAQNGVIGREGGMPWKLSTDLKRFKADTTGNPVVMGRKTYEGIGKPLPGRLNIVVTRNSDWSADGVEKAGSLEEAITLANVRARCMSGAKEISIIGGGQIYAQALPKADRLHVTHVLAEIDGDAFFPRIDSRIWEPVRSSDHPAGEKDTHPTRHIVYRRRDHLPDENVMSDSGPN